MVFQWELQEPKMLYNTFNLRFEVLCLVSVGLGDGGRKEKEHEKQHCFEIRNWKLFASV